MKTIQFHVRAALPKRLEVLWTLARNVWWSWNSEAISLFRRISPDAYTASGPCPLKLLNTLPASTWQELAEDDGFLEHLDRVVERFEDYLRSGVHRPEPISQDGQVAHIGYFSMEYGLHESIPLYSGGLGVLAGDHLKTASDLALPLTAIGLFYSEGYFRQRIDRDGWQHEYYERNDPFYMPMQSVLDSNGAELKVSVTIEGRPVHMRLWSLMVGRIPLYLLDCDTPENPPEVRKLTSRLYSGGSDLRIQQEMVLGIGGARALRALNISPTVFHMNEGHSAFLALERIGLGVEMGLTWRESLVANKGNQVFTVHTPVPAGNDSFPIEKLRRYLGDIEGQYKIPAEDFFNLGRSPDSPEEFSMPVFAIRTSFIRNGVSMLHKEVSQHIWKPLWPKLQETEVPITGVTNGVHTRTWLSNENVDLFDRYLGKGWDGRLDEPKMWDRIDVIPDSEIWDSHLRRKSRLIATIIRGVENAKSGQYGRANALRHSLRPEILTLGFARRFATYKRGALIFRDIERLKRIVLNEKCPVQIVIAGKAHPRDNNGKEVIQAVWRAIERAGIGHRVVLLEDYDMNMAQRLVRGVDVWINTPVRRLEASGTSGMKVGINGGLNLSVLDGWWDEGFNGTNGFAIGGREDYSDTELRDQIQADAFYEVLEQHVVPLYYSSSVPADWIACMKSALKSVGMNFSAQRMVLDYVERAYRPCQKFFEKWDLTSSEQVRLFKHHVQDIEKIRHGWDSVKILDVNVKPAATVNVGQDMSVVVTIKSPFPENWLSVVLLSMDGHAAPPNEVVENCFALKVVERPASDTAIYSIILKAGHPGVRTYTIRVTPNMEIFPDALDLHLVTRYE
jgi:starch phosphorylase